MNRRLVSLDGEDVGLVGLVHDRCIVVRGLSHIPLFSRLENEGQGGVSAEQFIEGENERVE